MICLTCTLSIIRILKNPHEETFVVCGLDGQLMTSSLVECNRHNAEGVTPEQVEDIKQKVEYLKKGKKWR